jgi:hypothetical protein
MTAMKNSLKKFILTAAATVLLGIAVSAADRPSPDQLRAEAKELMAKAHELKEDGQAEASEKVLAKAKQLVRKADELSNADRPQPDRKKNAAREDDHGSGRTDEHAQRRDSDNKAPREVREHREVREVREQREEREPRQRTELRVREERRDQAERPQRRVNREPQMNRPQPMQHSPQPGRSQGHREQGQMHEGNGGIHHFEAGRGPSQQHGRQFDGGHGNQPGTPGNRGMSDFEQRKQHVREAIRHLRAAGFNQPADRLEDALRRRMEGDSR